MDIGVTCNGEWCLDAEGMRAVILGKVVWKRCYACENGAIYVSDDGEVISPQAAAESEDWYKDRCEDCLGVGFIFVSVER